MPFKPVSYTRETARLEDIATHLRAALSALESAEQRAEDLDIDLMGHANFKQYVRLCGTTLTLRALLADQEEALALHVRTAFIE